MEAPSSGLGFPKARVALSYAELRHAGQLRKFDGAPFIVHPLEVADLLRECGECDELVAAGVLHDVIEKAGADPEELRERFGASVAALVVAVSEDPSIKGYAERKAGLREQVAQAGADALKLFAADKLSKVRELSLHETTPPPRRLAHYGASVELLTQRLPRYALTRQLAADFEHLEGLIVLGSGARR